MRSYYVDEFTTKDMKSVLEYLESKGLQGSMEGIYWLTLPEALLSQEQRSHMGECGPFVATLETGAGGIKMELLIRGRGKLRCSCINYATTEQRDWLISQVDAMLRELDIAV